MFRKYRFQIHFYLLILFSTALTSRSFSAIDKSRKEQAAAGSAKRKNNKKIIALIALPLFFSAAFLFFFYRNSSETEQKNQKKPFDTPQPKPQRLDSTTFLKKKKERRKNMNRNLQKNRKKVRKKILSKKTNSTRTPGTSIKKKVGPILVQKDPELNKTTRRSGTTNQGSTSSQQPIKKNVTSKLSSLKTPTTRSKYLTSKTLMKPVGNKDLVKQALVKELKERDLKNLKPTNKKIPSKLSPLEKPTTTSKSPTSKSPLKPVSKEDLVKQALLKKLQGRDLNELKTIGAGQHGKIFEVGDYVLKIPNPKKIYEETNRLKKEKELLEKLKGEGMVICYGAIKEGIKYNGKDIYTLVLEKLTDFDKSKKTNFIASYIPLFELLQYFQLKDLNHNDVSRSNIMYSPTAKHLKYIDPYATPTNNKKGDLMDTCDILIDEQLSSYAKNVLHKSLMDLDKFLKSVFGLPEEQTYQKYFYKFSFYTYLEEKFINFFEDEINAFEGNISNADITEDLHAIEAILLQKVIEYTLPYVKEYVEKKEQELITAWEEELETSTKSFRIKFGIISVNKRKIEKLIKKNKKNELTETSKKTNKNNQLIQTSKKTKQVMVEASALDRQVKEKVLKQLCETKRLAPLINLSTESIDLPTAIEQMKKMAKKNQGFKKFSLPHQEESQTSNEASSPSIKLSGNKEVEIFWLKVHMGFLASIVKFSEKFNDTLIPIIKS